MGKHPAHTDDEPFRRLVDQPEEALEEIYALYAGPLKAYIRTFITTDDVLIQDVLSETLTVVIWSDRKEVGKMDREEVLAAICGAGLLLYEQEGMLSFCPPEKKRRTTFKRW